MPDWEDEPNELRRPLRDNSWMPVPKPPIFTANLFTASIEELLENFPVLPTAVASVVP